MDEKSLNDVEITPLESPDLADVAGGEKIIVCSIHHCSYPQD